MSIVLKNQIEAFEKSALELDSAIAVEPISFRQDLEQLMKNMVAMHTDVDREIQRWQNANVSDEEGARLDAQGRRLENTFQKVFGLIQALKTAGINVEGKADFLSAWKLLRGVVCFTREGVAEAAGQVERGEVKPPGDVKRELWDSPVSW